MKKINLNVMMLLFLSVAASGEPLVGGTLVESETVEKTFGVNVQSYVGIDTPAIPIGPHISLTCGHCVLEGSMTPNLKGVVFPAAMKAESDKTNELYENQKAGNFGISFFKVANYSYDFAVIITDEVLTGPFVSVATDKVQKNEQLMFLGMGRNTSSGDTLCSWYDTQHKFAVGSFQVLDFYSQDVGFLVKGIAPSGIGGSQAPAPVTCPGDSGGYYFRVRSAGGGGAISRVVELVGINSWGTAGGITETHGDGSVSHYDGGFSGAGDLTSDGIRTWLNQLISQNHVEICGVNLKCGAVNWPF